MAEIDPEIPIDAIEDASGNGAMVAAMAVILIWACQTGVPALKLQVQHLLCGESAACPRPVPI